MVYDHCITTDCFPEPTTGQQLYSRIGSTRLCPRGWRGSKDYVRGAVTAPVHIFASAALGGRKEVRAQRQRALRVGAAAAAADVVAEAAVAVAAVALGALVVAAGVYDSWRRSGTDRAGRLGMDAVAARTDEAGAAAVVTLVVWLDRSAGAPWLGCMMRRSQAPCVLT